MAKTVDSVTVSVRVEPAVEQALRSLAAREGVAYADYLRRLLDDAIAWGSRTGPAGRSLQVVA